MPFSPISVNSKTFIQSGQGRYMLDSVAFGDPADYFQIKGGSINRSRSLVTAAVSRILEKDVTVDSITSRRQLSVQTIISSPVAGFTSSEIDILLSDSDLFITEAILNRLLNGES
jgi:hypothetical protein